MHRESLDHSVTIDNQRGERQTMQRVFRHQHQVGDRWRKPPRHFSENRLPQLRRRRAVRTLALNNGEEAGDVVAHAVDRRNRHGKAAASRNHDRSRGLSSAAGDELDQRRLRGQRLRHRGKCHARCVESEPRLRRTRRRFLIARPKQPIAQHARAPSLGQLERLGDVPRCRDGREHRRRSELGSAESIGHLKGEHTQRAVAQPIAPRIQLVGRGREPALRIGGIAKRETRRREPPLRKIARNVLSRVRFGERHPKKLISIRGSAPPKRDDAMLVRKCRRLRGATRSTQSAPRTVEQRGCARPVAPPCGDGREMDVRLRRERRVGGARGPVVQLTVQRRGAIDIPRRERELSDDAQRLRRSPCIAELPHERECARHVRFRGDRIVERDRDLREIQRGPREWGDAPRRFALDDRFAEQSLRGIQLLAFERRISTPLKNRRELAPVAERAREGGGGVEEAVGGVQSAESFVAAGRNVQAVGDDALRTGLPREPCAGLRLGNRLLARGPREHRCAAAADAGAQLEVAGGECARGGVEGGERHLGR